MNGEPTLLVVDDEASNLESLERIFAREGLAVLTARDGKDALEVIRKRRIDVLLTDLMMPGISGVDLLKAVKQLSPETETVVMTAYGTVEAAVEAMREGAYDFITKPLKRASVVRVVAKALEKQSLLVENKTLKAQLEATRRRPMVGQSLAMRRTLEVVQQAAPSMATVLLLGESGTGKELLARQIHDSSPRAARPFVPVNCAAIPEGILEGELFGYEKGAFTGAVARRDGRFALADGGTLFLDEIGEIPLSVQVKLLRVLQEGEVERLGGKSQKIDIRLVAATNKDLRRAVADGSFREDLYYRLNVIAVNVPPLRDRRDDIPLLVDHFLARFRDKNGKLVSGCTRAALDVLTEHDWPGNVRELENAMERAVVLTKATVIDVEDLPREVRGAPPLQSGSGRALTFEIGTPLEDIEMRVIHETLRHTRGDKRLAAQLLGIATRTIYRKLEPTAAIEDGSKDPDGASGYDNLAMEPPAIFSK
ncbi:MAG: two component, sigma54 specific, transcriptional regulator, Fis family [Myxococcales bacterium]|nr:two component, sigma54 specific, transcriptional regulator, Fis family [Myxococcales bacterium]